MVDWGVIRAGVWRAKRGEIKGVEEFDKVRFDDLIGIESQKEQFKKNIERFLNNEPFNHMLLWGSRGTGKSSLVKALLNEYSKIRVVEFNKDDLGELPDVVDGLRKLKYYFVIFCDDISYDDGDSSYKGLKPILEGSIESPPKNVLICVTSNRRHLVSESIRDNDGVSIKHGELHYGDAVEEKISLSDRFGLWLSFYQGTQEEYLKIVASYFKGLHVDADELRTEALRFAQSRASRSGRTAKQFYNTYKNELVKK